MACESPWPPDAIYTLGHSTLPADQFIELLNSYGIERLVDIRTIPRSRHNPQFNADELAETLPSAGVAYVPMPALGGLRPSRKDSPNGAWRNKSFRGYADYMQTDEFAAAVDELIAGSESGRTAIMCAEAVPWRCHRSLVADALQARGVPAVEIMSATNARMHTMTSFARVDGTQVTYPPEDET